MEAVVELGFKRWLRSRVNTVSATIHEICPEIYLVKFSLSGVKYLFPAMKCKCSEKNIVKINGKEFCEAEYCNGYIDKLFACDKVTVDNHDFEPSVLEGAIAEDATNPHVSLVSNRGKYVLKGYRIHASWNPEPLFLRFLRETSLAPKLSLSYSYMGVTLGVVTEFISGGIDPGAIFYESLVHTLRGEGFIIPEKEIAGIARTVAEFHNRMSRCREEWCEPATASKEDLEVWFRRFSTYVSRIKGLVLPREIKRIFTVYPFPHFERFLGKTIIATHQDLHFSQMLKTKDRFYIVDFEGEPGRPEEFRRSLEPAIRDVASMLRGLSYIAFFALAEANGLDRHGTLALLHEGGEQVRLAQEWTRVVCEKLLREYLRNVNRDLANTTSLSDAFDDIREWFIERAFYEAYYEADYRPENVLVALATIVYEIPKLIE